MTEVGQSLIRAAMEAAAIARGESREMIRVCPKRDAICPHGMECPYTVDRYTCKKEPPPQTQNKEP